jgi:hypothetical protein
MGRYDRVIVRSSNYQPSTIEQLGTTPIPPSELKSNGVSSSTTTSTSTAVPVAATVAIPAKVSSQPPRVYPSDHFGLLATLVAV